MTKLQVEIYKNHFEYLDGKRQIKIKTIPLGTSFSKEVYKNFYSNIFSFYFKSITVETVKEHPWFVATPYQDGILFTYRNLVPDLLILKKLQETAEKHLNTPIVSVYVYKLPELPLEQLAIPRDTLELQGVAMETITSCYPSSPSGFAILQEREGKRLFSSLFPAHPALSPLAKYILGNGHGITAKFLIKCNDIEDQENILQDLRKHPIFSEIFSVQNDKAPNIQLDCLVIFSTYLHVLYFKRLLSEEFGRAVNSRVI